MPLFGWIIVLKSQLGAFTVSLIKLHRNKHPRPDGWYTNKCINLAKIKEFIGKMGFLWTRAFAKEKAGPLHQQRNFKISWDYQDSKTVSLSLSQQSRCLGIKEEKLQGRQWKVFFTGIYLFLANVVKKPWFRTSGTNSFRDLAFSLGRKEEKLSGEKTKTFWKCSGVFIIKPVVSVQFKVWYNTGFSGMQWNNIRQNKKAGNGNNTKIATVENGAWKFLKSLKYPMRKCSRQAWPSLRATEPTDVYFIFELMKTIL